MGIGERRRSALERKRLVRKLSGIRQKIGYTQAQVAGKLRWSQSKVHRIESGENSISYTDLLALLKIYDIRENELVEELTEMAELARQRSLPEISDIHSKDFRDYLEAEITADTMLEFENSYIPGLLQTPAYANAVLRTLLQISSLADDERESVLDRIRRMVDLRALRQQIFNDGGITKASFVLDEAAVRRAVGAEAGDAGVMRAQVEHLKKMCRHPRVDLRVVPFGAGSHVGMSGPFVILNFPDPDDFPLLYLENAAGEFLTKHDQRQVRRFAANFESLQACALQGAELDALLDDVIAAIG
ncbi:helix-turn-helix transcriptional regulator [Actinoplanes sp. NPDC051346]|uniref:helix-turn-helix domain-containing protein n=1 Tax=Actinoplanes sp. NPDC051346 TaxID=3155048 RepID=UPI0034217AE5